MNRALIAGAVVLVLVLVVAQLVLPGVAERRARDELEKVGAVSAVEVSSFPAVKLLFGDIDSLTGRLGDSESTDGEVADLIARAQKIDTLRVSAESIRISGLELNDARLAKDGDDLRAESTLTERNLLSFLPPGVRLTEMSSDRGDLLVVGSFSALGFRVSGPARVTSEAGNVVLTPEGIPGAGLAQITLFADDRVRVQRISARESGGRLRLTAEGILGG